MAGEEKELLKKYLTHLNVLGKDGSHPHFEAWYQAVRYAQSPGAPSTLQEASELRYKDLLDAAFYSEGLPLFTLRHRRLWARATPARPLWLPSGSG